MKSRLCVLVVCLPCAACWAGLLTDVYYTVEPIQGERWMYHYEVSNPGLAEGVHEFTIWFDYGDYANLEIASLPELADGWDQLIWQPNEALLSSGGFDALTEAEPIAINQSVSGFVVAFDWLPEGQPGSQYYEIIDPATFEVIGSGFTIPEPASVLFLALAALKCVCRRRNVSVRGQ